MSNSVYIATSLDGYIADQNDGLDWLHTIPNPNGDDMGYAEHFSRIDAMVMGRNTMEMVLSFGIEWPYTKPVFVLSNTLTSVPNGYEDKIFLVKGELKSVLQEIKDKGFNDLYIDGGVTVQSFLKEDLIDELIISTIPILLGGGSPLFGNLVEPLNFKLVKSQSFLNAIVQSHYVRDKG
ncbi:dihydrofolate reductase family protein [Vibrio tapetis]|uniref:Pyrimidine reductase n=1 Tax=Vibrio tapetis subsp. tapetis TaxID=1671868 RepID=A0A2N8ZJ55_9VIBR|nr:dihydrofolate reductase family protein [Vibrio tapetis]SON51927.1 Pyrimidine reductase [Vibrio tapetis subsp. tapetis]